MIHTKKIYCRWDGVGNVVEAKSLERNCMISIYDRIESIKGPKETLDLELGIFLDKADNYQEYEVLVIKSKKTDEYIPLEADNIKRFEDHGDSISFFFDSFDVALSFVDEVLPFHEEFQNRPIKPIF